MRIIASANQKGGCGKTTTAINLSASLALRGKKVLLIDCDPQAHATIGLKINPLDLEMSMYDVMKPGKDDVTYIEDILYSINDNFDFAPSSAKLSAVEQELSGIDGREDMLYNAIRPLKQAYDYIIIDSPPSIGHLSFNVLRACTEVIIPIDLSLFSLRGVSKLTEIIIMLKEKLGHEIQSRALITMYDLRTRYSRHVLEKVKEEFGQNVFETVIRYNIRLREAVDYGMPIADYDKRSIGHKDYEKLAEEVIESELAGKNQAFQTLDAAHDLFNRTENYIDTAIKTTVIEDEPAPEAEDLLSDHAYETAFHDSAMADMAAINATDSIFSTEDNDEDNIETDFG
jgi:chromosome partitioning protein